MDTNTRKGTRHKGDYIHMDKRSLRIIVRMGEGLSGALAGTALTKPHWSVASAVGNRIVLERMRVGASLRRMPAINSRQYMTLVRPQHWAAYQSIDIREYHVVGKRVELVLDTDPRPHTSEAGGTLTNTATGSAWDLSADSPLHPRYDAPTPVTDTDIRAAVSVLNGALVQRAGALIIFTDDAGLLRAQTVQDI